MAAHHKHATQMAAAAVATIIPVVAAVPPGEQQEMVQIQLAAIAAPEHLAQAVRHLIFWAVTAGFWAVVVAQPIKTMVMVRPVEQAEELSYSAQARSRRMEMQSFPMAQTELQIRDPTAMAAAVVVEQA